jgi:hypothetical protein
VQIVLARSAERVRLARLYDEDDAREKFDLLGSDSHPRRAAGDEIDLEHAVVNVWLVDAMSEKPIATGTLLFQGPTSQHLPERDGVFATIMTVEYRGAVDATPIGRYVRRLGVGALWHRDTMQRESRGFAALVRYRDIRELVHRDGIGEIVYGLDGRVPVLQPSRREPVAEVRPPRTDADIHVVHVHPAGVERCTRVAVRHRDALHPFNVRSRVTHNRVDHVHHVLARRLAHEWRLLLGEAHKPKDGKRNQQRHSEKSEPHRVSAVPRVGAGNVEHGAHNARSGALFPTIDDTRRAVPLAGGRSQYDARAGNMGAAWRDRRWRDHQVITLLAAGASKRLSTPMSRRKTHTISTA